MAAPGPLALSQDDWEGLLAASPLPLVTVLWAGWCLPCATLLPVVEEVAAAHAGRVRFATVDVDRFPSLVERLGIVGLPTTLVFSGGEERARRVGLMPRGHLERLIAEHAAG